MLFAADCGQSIDSLTAMPYFIAITLPNYKEKDLTAPGVISGMKERRGSMDASKKGSPERPLTLLSPAWIQYPKSSPMQSLTTSHIPASTALLSSQRDGEKGVNNASSIAFISPPSA